MMRCANGVVVGVTGLSGAGKTTAVQHLQSLGLGRAVYLGSIILEEVSKRGLAMCPENERLVRLSIREEFGGAALVGHARSIIEQHLAGGINVLVDAVFTAEEYEALQTCRGISRPLLIAVDASFETRCQRLEVRPHRPLTREEVEKRDSTEIVRLGTSATMSMAHRTITNESSLDEFKRDLEAAWSALADPEC